jgi:hypothetical protein
MKISPLDTKKKKVIQNIRRLLNDHPQLHPLAHKVLLSATYTVLKRLHRDILRIDGYDHRYSPREKVAGYAKAIENAKQFTSKRSLALEVETKVSSPSLKGSDKSISNENKKQELENKAEREKKRKEREEKRRKALERQKSLDRDILELMGLGRDII